MTEVTGFRTLKAMKQKSFTPRGVIPPVITPLTDNEQVNNPALRKLLDFLVSEGVHGVFPVGTTGEFYALTEFEYQSILETTVDQIRGRVPVYAGVNHITTRGAINLVRIAQASHVDALSVLTPMFISPSQDDLYEHYVRIAAETDLPIILYNNKPKTGVDIKPETAARLANIENIIGIKDSTGDLTNTEEYIRLTQGQDFHVLMGRDTLIYASLCYGAAGAIAACANIAPRLCADIYNHFIAGDHEQARALQYKIAPLRIAFTIGTFPAVIKAGLSLLGLDAGPCYAPIRSLEKDEIEKLRTIMHSSGLI